jgi:hypothetical protein
MSKPFDCIANFEQQGFEVQIFNPISENNWIAMIIKNKDVWLQKFLKTDSEKQKVLSQKFTILTHIHGFEIV